MYATQPANHHRRPQTDRHVSPASALSGSIAVVAALRIGVKMSTAPKIFLKRSKLPPWPFCICRRPLWSAGAGAEREGFGERYPVASSYVTFSVKSTIVGPAVRVFRGIGRIGQIEHSARVAAGLLLQGGLRFLLEVQFSGNLAQYRDVFFQADAEAKPFECLRFLAVRCRRWSGRRLGHGVVVRRCLCLSLLG